MKFKEKIANSKNSKKGITLIALVITIVVLLILAAISINLILGDNGILYKANESKNKWVEAETSDQEGLGYLVDTIDSSTKDVNQIQKLKDLVGEKASETENTIAQDEYGNKIVIPAGFAVVAHGGTTNITYGYSGDTSKPTVQDGIVIQDDKGNQFVWVPVGNIKNKDGSTTTITLGRYTFDANGTPTVKQTADSTSAMTPVQVNSYHWEVSKDYEGALGNSVKNAKTETNNIKAYNLQKWIDTTLTNRGYYIARYEASYGGIDSQGNHIPLSKVLTKTTGNWIKSNSTIGYLWNNITQPDAATASQKMYPDSSEAKVYSDLVNSYAWDTAIMFIQEYSEYSDYSRKKSADMKTMGDKVCNIYNIASNSYEWTTETSIYIVGPCTSRGDDNYSSVYASHRGCCNASYYYDNYSFRVTLCVK